MLQSRSTRARARKPVIVAAAVIALVVIVFAIVAARTKPAVDQVVPSPLIYHQAPELSGESLNGSGRLSLSSYRGQFVLVNYFASWCTTCASEEPQLVKIANSGVVQVLGVDFEDSAPNARHFLAHFGANFPVIQDPNGQNALRWGVSAPPESFLVAPDGVVLAKIVGPTSTKIVDELVVLAKQKGY